jgi:hypothetical protein
MLIPIGLGLTVLLVRKLFLIKNYFYHFFDNDHNPRAERAKPIFFIKPNCNLLDRISPFLFSASDRILE